MRRLLAMLLTVVLVCSMSNPVFAAQDEKENNVTVKYVSTVEGAYVAPVQNGVASINADGVSVSVTSAPSNAKTLVVIPMTGDALSWIDSCVDGDAKAAYDIHFKDTEGNSIGANGASVSVAVSGSELIVSSVNTSGTDKNLSSTTSGGTVSFTTDGNNYYVVWEKKTGGETITVPVRGDENTVHADVTITDEDTVKLHELDFEEIDHIVGDKDKDGLIEIDLTKLDEDVCKIILPVTSIEHITSEAEETHNEHEALQVYFPHGSVKLDDKTMRAIVEQAECNEVILVLEDVGETRLNEKQENAVKDWNIYGGYEAYPLCVKANKRISDFEGGVATLSVPFTVPNGLDANQFSVRYVADDGKTEKLDTRYANEYLIWDVGHFSDFIIVYEGELPHVHSYKKVITAPTCTEKGYTTYTCSCGDSYVDDYINAIGHSFTKYASNNDATCTKNGTETAKCDHGCGETRTRTDFGSKLGHKYEDGKCIRCGTKQWIPQTGDTESVFLWAGILVLSLTALFFTWILNRGKKN